MATVTFDKATRIYPGNDKPAVDNLDLEIADGEFLVLVGPSGCGKSTSLRMLAGLEEVNAGEIFIGDRDVTDLSPKDRDIAMVFQNYALYPHMTVADNMGFALKIAGVDKAEIRRRVEEAAKILDLGRVPRAQAEGPLRWPAPARRHGPRDRPRAPGVPHGRAAVATSTPSCACRPAPRSRRSSAGSAITTVYVTHDQVEAMTMGDRVAVLKDGMLQQCDSPRRMYDHPANVFVAGFIGSPAMNLFEVPVVDGGVTFGTGVARSTATSRPGAGRRPSHARRPPRGPGHRRRRGPAGRRSTSSRSSAPTPTSTARCDGADGHRQADHRPRRRPRSRRRRAVGCTSRRSPSTCTFRPDDGRAPGRLTQRAALQHTSGVTIRDHSNHP